MARGSIRKHERDSGVRYEVVVDYGPDPVTGKRRQRTKSFKTKRVAQAALTAWLSEIDRGTAIDRSTQTVVELMRYWLDTYARPRLRAKTVFDYEHTINKHIVQALGPLPIQKLTPERLQRFYSDKLAEGCGVRTIRLCHLHINQALKQAVKLGLTSRNVASLVTQPQEPPKEMQVWDAPQAQAFLTVADKSAYGPIWVLALATGLRRGELLGLRWRDIDFDRRVLHVRQTVGSLRGRPEFKPPKTRSSRRDVSLPDAVMAALKEHRRRQNEQRLALGEAWQDHDLVFAAANGNPINLDNVGRDFQRLIQLAAVPAIRIHDLRHTHVTLALQAGANTKALSQALGHSDISITLGTYAHVMPEQRVEVAEKISAALFGQRPKVNGHDEDGRA
jgi:integrase